MVILTMRGKPKIETVIVSAFIVDILKKIYMKETMMSKIVLNINELKKIMMRQKNSLVIIFFTSMILALIVATNLPIIYKKQFIFTVIKDDPTKPKITAVQKIISKSSPDKLKLLLTDKLSYDIKKHIKKIEVSNHNELTTEVINLSILIDSKDHSNEIIEHIPRSYLELVNQELKWEIDLNSRKIEKLRNFKFKKDSSSFMVDLKLLEFEEEKYRLSKFGAVEYYADPVLYEIRMPNQSLSFLVIFISSLLILTTFFFIKIKKNDQQKN
jgi:hypothetical protein